MPHAAGAALAFQLRGEARCALGYIGDGGTSQGAFYEAINFAGARGLPLIAMVVNNQYAISAPVRVQTACETLAQKGIAAGIRCLQIDGNDLLAVRGAVGEAAERARARRRPDADRGAQLPALRPHHLRRCHPLSRRRRGGRGARARTDDPHAPLPRGASASGTRNWSSTCAPNARAEIEEAVRQYLATPRQSVDSMFEHVLARLPRGLEAQRDEARRFSGRR